MQQTLIKVHDRVGWIAEMAVTEKLKKMWQSMTWGRRSSKYWERPTNESLTRTVLDQLGHGCRANVFPPPGEDDNNALASALNDGDSPGELDDAPSGVGVRLLRMDIASCYMRRHHDEDSHFAHADAGVLGVADGVSGFREKGVDVGAFARALINHASAKVSRAPRVLARPGAWTPLLLRTIRLSLFFFIVDFFVIFDYLSY
jgi:hypothetical protein